MTHSGCNGGKKWRIQVFEKMGPCELKIFDTKVVAAECFGNQAKDCTQGLRPIRAIEFLEEWLITKDTFPYESHAVKVFDKVLKRPLFFRRNRE